MGQLTLALNNFNGTYYIRKISSSKVQSSKVTTEIYFDKSIYDIACFQVQVNSDLLQV